MKLLLVPREGPWTYALRIYKLTDETLDDLAEVRTHRGQRIALALIQQCARSVALLFPEQFNRLAAAVEIDDCDSAKLVSALKRLEAISSSRIIPEELAENPTFERLEKFLSLKKLLDP